MAGESHEVLANGGPPGPFDESVAHVARVYNYWLGGKDNFAADRAAGEQAIRAFPEIGLSARSNRAFLARARNADPTQTDAFPARSKAHAVDAPNMQGSPARGRPAPRRPR